MNIITHKKIFLIIAGCIVVSALAIVFFLGLRPGIDFTGGSLMEVQYDEVPDKAVLEGIMAEQDLGSVSIRQSRSETGEGYIITTRDLSEAERVQVQDAVVAAAPGGEVTRFTSVGPTIGKELQDKAVWAIGAVLVLIILYVAYAFAGIGTPVSSWVYGLLTILILAHDILVPIAAMSLFGYFLGFEVDVLFVTALLTILGYSVNDTIVIFDRIREKLKENRTEAKTTRTEPGGVVHTTVVYTLTKPFGEIVGQAIEETMARSINTSLTVLIALVALYIFGSAVTANFALVLIVGLIAGAYSSIFIASPLLVLYDEWQTKRKTSQ